MHSRCPHTYSITLKRELCLLQNFQLRIRRNYKRVISEREYIKVRLHITTCGNVCSTHMPRPLAYTDDPIFRVQEFYIVFFTVLE